MCFTVRECANPSYFPMVFRLIPEHGGISRKPGKSLSPNALQLDATEQGNSMLVKVARSHKLLKVTYQNTFDLLMDSTNFSMFT